MGSPRAPVSHPVAKNVQADGANHRPGGKREPSKGVARQLLKNFPASKDGGDVSRAVVRHGGYESTNPPENDRRAEPRSNPRADRRIQSGDRYYRPRRAWQC